MRKPTKHDYVINGESLAHAVRGFGCENNKHTLFPNMFMDHYLQIEYDLHILNLAMSFDATYYKKCAKYELILLIAMSFDAFLKKYIILNEKE